MKAKTLWVLLTVTLFAISLGAGLATAQSSSDVLVFGQLQSATGDPIIGSDEIAPPPGTTYSSLEEYLLYYPGVQRPQGIFSHEEVLYTGNQTFINGAWKAITLDRAFRIDDDSRVLYIKIVHGVAGTNRQTIYERIANVKEFNGLTDQDASGTSIDNTLLIVAASAAATLASKDTTVIFVANGTVDNQMLIGGVNMSSYNPADLSIILK